MIRQAYEWCCWGPKSPTAHLSSMQWSMVRNRPCFCVWRMFSNYLQVQMKIIWESEVTIEPKHCQCTYKNISLQSRLHFKEWGEWWRTNKGNITPPSSLPPPTLRSSSAPSAGGKHHFSGPLVAFHSIGLIVFLFICFTIDFSVEADVAVIRSDWLSWCDGWNKASKQTQCEISVTPLCVSAWVTMHVSVCSVGCLCLCLHLLFVLCRNASVHRFACMCVQRDEHAVAAGEKKCHEMHDDASRLRFACHCEQSQMRWCLYHIGQTYW